jgi:hypothetical protein
MSIVAHSRRLLWSLPATFLVVASLGAGCSYTLGAVNPKPNVVVGRSVGRASLDLSAVDDTQRPDQDGGAPNMWKVSVTQFRNTLESGFRNAMGSHYSVEGEGTTRLVFDTAELRFSNLGDLGRFLTIRYKAHWLDARGNVVAELAGVAQPRNPTETGKRHLEDVVEVLYEQAIEGLEKVARR